MQRRVQRVRRHRLYTATACQRRPEGGEELGDHNQVAKRLIGQPPGGRTPPGAALCLRWQGGDVQKLRLVARSIAFLLIQPALPLPLPLRPALFLLQRQGRRPLLLAFRFEERLGLLALCRPLLFLPLPLGLGHELLPASVGI